MEDDIDVTPIKDLDIQDHHFDFNELGDEYVSDTCKKCQSLKE